MGPVTSRELISRLQGRSINERIEDPDVRLQIFTTAEAAMRIAD